MIAVDRPGRISARNVIPARVVACDPMDQHVMVQLDAEERLTTRVTPGAAASLSLETGANVFLVIKAHAFRRLG